VKELLPNEVSLPALSYGAEETPIEVTASGLAWSIDVVDVGLHAQRMTIDDAANFLFENGLSDESLDQAKRHETGRYAVYPTQAMTYNVGRRQIERLRDAWVHTNPTRPLADFHAQFLSYGPIAPDPIREFMMLH
jgi:uncharacterized protein (DUF885 family)